MFLHSFFPIIYPPAINFAPHTGTTYWEKQQNLTTPVSISFYNLTEVLIVSHNTYFQRADLSEG